MTALCPIRCFMQYKSSKPLIGELARTLHFMSKNDASDSFFEFRYDSTSTVFDSRTGKCSARKAVEPVNGFPQTITFGFPRECDGLFLFQEIGFHSKKKGGVILRR